MNGRYLLDTNIFIESENFRYPHDFFKGIWDFYEHYITNKSFFSIDHVYKELIKGNDFVSNWAVEHKSLFVSSGAEGVSYFSEMEQILKYNQCKEKNVQEFFSGIADPFIISYAKATNSTVVTNEVSVKNNFQGHVKIPDMCRELEVRCISLTELFKELKPLFILDKTDR